MAPRVDQGAAIVFDCDLFCALIVPMLECTEAFILAVDQWIDSR